MGHDYGFVDDDGVCAEGEGFVEFEYQGFGDKLFDDFGACAVPGGWVDDGMAIVEGTEADVKVVEAWVDEMN